MEEREAAADVSDVQGLSSELDEETSATQRENATVSTDVKAERGSLRLLREILETIVLTLVIFAVINTFTGRFRVEGPSMMPNLHQGQYLIINKLVYRLHPPRRGDIIVFHHPRNAKRDLIKRVIGLPGETVEVREGQVHIGGALLEEPYISQPGRYSSRYELGPDEYFVLGDNRPNSDDSHNWGALNIDRIVGKAWVSYWPPDDWGGLAHHSFADNVTAGKNVRMSVP